MRLLQLIQTLIAAIGLLGSVVFSASAQAEHTQAEDKAVDDQLTQPFNAGQSDSVGFQQVWREILLESGIEFAFVEAPRARKRRMFVEGSIVLDCCAAPLWRVEPEEIATQRWSETFYVTREQFLFRAGEAFPVRTPEDLSKLRVATVRGFDYRDSEHFGVSVPGRDLEDTFRLLHAGRADVGIVSNVDFYALAGKVPGAFMLGPIRVRAPQKIRVHKSVEYLLTPINKAIQRLNEQGRIEAILEGMPSPSNPGK